MAASEAKQQLRPKLDLLESKNDPNHVLARLEELERQVAELKRRGQ